MYKNVNRFLQSRAASGRTLSGYPEGRELRTGRLSNDGQFEVGTVYLKKISSTVRGLLRAGLTRSQIAEELARRRFETPSGEPWTDGLLTQLFESIQVAEKTKQRSKNLRQKRDNKRR